MKSFLSAASRLGTRPRPTSTPITSTRWTCAECRGTQWSRPRGPLPAAARAFTSRVRPNGRMPPRRTGAILLASGGGVAAAGALAFADDIKNGYGAAERAGRVAATLFICINDYRTTLNQRETEEDEKRRTVLLNDCHQRCADRTLKLLESQGGIFIKLGQHLSAMNYLLPPEWTNTFIPLQDRCPVSSYDSIIEMFRLDTGEDLTDVFSDFSLEPIGAASLAQVHTATIKETGQQVAVKVQHPGLAQWARLDLALTGFSFSMLKRFFPEYDLEWLYSEIEVSLPKELDFREEERNARRTKEYFARLPEHPLLVPEVLWARQRILVMARESGARLDDLAYLDANGIDRDEVSACLSRLFNEMIFGNGAPLHCDPHGGNLAIRLNTSRGARHNFDIILYDHGLYRDIPRDLQRSYAKMWLAVIDGDMTRMRRYAKEVAHITDEQFPIFASAITGRDYRVLAKKERDAEKAAAAAAEKQSSGPSILETRTEDEKKQIGDALSEGLLADLVTMLGQVPRIILLILKTNDLTRALDENLQTRQGPIRTFMILARYCTRTVFEEQLEELHARGSLLWPPNTLRFFAIWAGFLRVEIKIGAYEMWLGVKRALGLKRTDLASPGAL